MNEHGVDGIGRPRGAGRGLNVLQVGIDQGIVFLEYWIKNMHS